MANLGAKSSVRREIWKSLQDGCTTSVLALVALVFERGFDMDIGIGFGHFNVVNDELESWFHSSSQETYRAMPPFEL